MNDAKKVLYTFSPDRPIRQITNIIRAQIAGKGLEKNFALKTLEAKNRFDEIGNRHLFILDLLVKRPEIEEVIYALMYLDGNGFGEKSLNDLLVISRMCLVDEPLEYSFD